MIKTGYLVSKVWALLCYLVTGIGWVTLVNDEAFSSILDQLMFIFVGLTIATIPLAIMRYIKTQKQKETRNALQ